MFETLCINICNSLENLRKLMCLEYAVDRLANLYTKDTFSGIYNRNGFVQATNDIYHDCMENGRDIMLMFIDLDGLKIINDTYGHDVGDRAICNIADVLRDSCTDGEIFCRFGGDEFIVFGADYTEEQAQQLTQRIEANIAGINASGENPFILSASSGYTIAKPKKGEDIFNFVTYADNMMYAEKRKKKQSRHLKKL
jgi:diguanylate cyclase (GGDEF)-like protein